MVASEWYFVFFRNQTVLKGLSGFHTTWGECDKALVFRNFQKLKSSQNVAFFVFQHFFDDRRWLPGAWGYHTVAKRFSFKYLYVPGLIWPTSLSLQFSSGWQREMTPGRLRSHNYMGEWENVIKHWVFKSWNLHKTLRFLYHTVDKRFSFKYLYVPALIWPTSLSLQFSPPPTRSKIRK